MFYACVNSRLKHAVLGTHLCYLAVYLGHLIAIMRDEIVALPESLNIAMCEIRHHDANPGIYQPIIYLTINLFVYMSVCLSIYLSVYLFIYLFIYFLFIYLFIYLFIFYFIFLFFIYLFKFIF